MIIRKDVSYACTAPSGVPAPRGRVGASSRQTADPARQGTGISRSCLQNWMRQADIDDGSRTGVPSADKDEVAALRRENRRLEMENEILKRAAAYFARENVLPK